jgi:hypothetical protein
MNTLKILTLTFIFATALTGCGFTENKTPGAANTTPSSGTPTGGTTPGGGTGGGTGTTTGSATFSQVNSAIIQASCLGCHGAGASRDFSTYANFIANGGIVAGNPSGSAALTAIQNGAMPPGGGISASDVTLMSTWIQDGALDN